MKPTKQTVYLPVKVENELPVSKDGFDIEILFQYKGTLFLGWFNPETKFFSTSNGLSEYYTDVDLWFKLQEVIVFTPEQLNEYTAKVGKTFLDAAAEKTEHHYANKDWVDKQSIKDTFEETFNKLKV